MALVTTVPAGDHRLRRGQRAQWVAAVRRLGGQPLDLRRAVRHYWHDLRGGDGGSTFNLPDLRGRIPIGAGTGVSLTARTLGQSLGEEAHL